MAELLVVDDCPEVRSLIKSSLESRYHLSFAVDTHHTLDLVNSRSFDLIILDIGLPDTDGFHLCAELRSREALSNTPIIFLTGKSGISDKLLGFSVGADDYITKPFDPRELSARIASKLDRLITLREKVKSLNFGDLQIDISSFTVKKIARDEVVLLDLTPLEVRLLHYLVRSAGRVVSRTQLLDSVWGTGISVVERTVDRHISTLRKKILGSTISIEPVHGIGYVLKKVEN